MNTPVFISICIPANERVDFLKRLLESIVGQTFSDFEVIVTDDSTTNEVELLCKLHMQKFTLHYYRNNPGLGSPENRNEAIRRANGEWIKIMHDDAWFTTEDSLRHFADAVRNNVVADFFFSAYNVCETDGKEKHVFANRIRLHHLQDMPFTLLGKNIIGPPSVTVYKNSGKFSFDKNLKRLADIDFYIRVLPETKFCYLHQPLVNISPNEQMTKSPFGNATGEIPENFYLLEKMGREQLKNISVFDAWWQLVRDLDIKDANTIREAGYPGEIPAPIRKIINFQKNIPKPILQSGFLSKTLMSTCFLLAG